MVGRVNRFFISTFDLFVFFLLIFISSQPTHTRAHNNQHNLPDNELHKHLSKPARCLTNYYRGHVSRAAAAAALLDY